MLEQNNKYHTRYLAVKICAITITVVLTLLLGMEEELGTG